MKTIVKRYLILNCEQKDLFLLFLMDNKAIIKLKNFIKKQHTLELITNVNVYLLLSNTIFV